jgi:glutamyl-tRNA(Gln) amidotransferase subunit E
MPDFKFKPFEQMTPEDYAEIGFKSGLEVHQQLLTEKKLFCRCPAGLYNNEVYHAEILRHMRPTLSELGEYDGTALMEFKTKKDIIYRINRDTVCTYEMDDTPPFEINEQALEIAIEVGMLFDATIVDEMHIARKQYLDGSIPTGFQRTAIVSVGGRFPYKDRDINLIQMSIEEDSCREVSDLGHTRIYVADRLGMPLIETVTHPEMRTPQEVAEVCEIISKTCRSTHHVRTGVGATREDVNVSVAGGTRIEIKGVPSIKRIPRLCYNEAMRQYNLLRLRDELNARGVNEETFEHTVKDVTSLLKNTKYKPINDSIGEGLLVKCVCLKGFKGLLNWKTQTDTYFSKEISDRVRVIACLTTLPNIIHSDGSEITISSTEGKKIRKFMGADDEKDALVLVWGDERDTTMGASEIAIRAKEATIGIPSETRQAMRDGTNGFERILPGPERMYPDTDLPPKQITDAWKNDIRNSLPKKYWENEDWYKTMDIPCNVMDDLLLSNYTKIFEEIVRSTSIDPRFVAVALINFPKKLKKKGYDISLIDEDLFRMLFQALSERKLVKEGFIVAMENYLKAGKYSNKILPKPASIKEIKKVISDSKKEFKKMEIINPDNSPEFFMGLVMNKLRGKADGDKVTEIILEITSREV